MIEPQAVLIQQAIVDALETIDEPAYWTRVAYVGCGRAGLRLGSSSVPLPALFVSIESDQIEEPNVHSKQQSQHQLSVVVELAVEIQDKYEQALLRLAQDVRRALELRSAQAPVGGAASSVSFPEPLTIYPPEASSQHVRAEFPMSFRYLESTKDG